MVRLFFKWDGKVTRCESSDRPNMGNNGMSEQGRIVSRNNGSSVGSSYELLNLKKTCFFLSFFATEL